MVAAATKFELARTDREVPTANRHGNPFVGLDHEPGLFDAKPHPATAEAHPEVERCPRGGKDRIYVQYPRSRTEPGEPEGEGLPQSAHGGQVQAGRS
jgi:hypothetical protein